MRIFKYITFLSILCGIFFVIYRKSKEKGFRRWWNSFKVAVVSSAVASDLIDINPESGKTFGNNSFQNNNQQVILVKADGNPVTPPTNRGPSNFPTSPSRGRPSRPITTPHVNRYPVVPKLVPGPGAGANPAGAGSGSGPTEFEDQCPAPKTQKSQASTYDYRSSSKKKKKESGMIYFSRNTGEVHFVNDMTGNWRTTVVQSESQLRNLAKNGFHLFPNAGE